MKAVSQQQITEPCFKIEPVHRYPHNLKYEWSGVASGLLGDMVHPIPQFLLLRQGCRVSWK
ncbi:hypothetical protein Hamer_G031496, partial [Homarus americanus]